MMFSTSLLWTGTSPCSRCSTSLFHWFTRLTNGFSKKLENLGHAVALHFMYYNFGCIHQSHRITPAMAAGISDHVWTLEEIAALDE